MGGGGPARASARGRGGEAAQGPPPAALLAGAGCFSPHPAEGIACTPDGRCPDGQSCIDGVCRGPGGGPDATDPGAGPPDGPIDASAARRKSAVDNS